ncbi:hypothetical protein RN001_009209 [Aquatica leii]|uniref:C2H2-type domain-containing protein n=1 Tax=Aquatica leii TaxID=1421715 RepID=A0AAN7SMT7_9COLE|nr:hypothetical protein RN001_009209 [Aquatica leii]
MATKIYPTCEELSTINSHIPCSEQGCTQIFSSQSNLNLHLEKTHKQERKHVSTLRQYYCPNLECIFNSEKCFKTLKLLKQHFLKVHSEKSFICSICNKGFPTLSSKNRHINYCGVNFKCCDCNAGYMLYESLLTHGRRKKHKILEKAAYNPKTVQSLDKIQLNYECVAKALKKEAFILPKPITSLQLIKPTSFVFENSSLPTLEKGSQTDVGVGLPKVKTKQVQVLHKRTKESQTCDLRRTHSSTETQTIGKRPRLSDSDTIVYKRASEDCLLHSVKTQTKLISSKSQSCNTSFELNDSDLVPSAIVAKNSSSTQTKAALSTDLLYSISTATHDSIHTDTSDLNFEFMHSSSQTCFSEDMSLFNSNYFNCNTETQTDFLFDNNLLDYDADANTFEEDLDNYCQKAYDDIIFNTIHTQTVFDDIARSVESQTMMSHTKTRNLACKDMANMETQTENDFKKLLEEINA